MSLTDRSNSNGEIQSPSKVRLSLAHLNPHLTCILCKGYMVDATTIVECLHSFCRTCIYQYLESSKYCPLCEVQVHKTKPLLNVRPDITMQSLVYKLVPGLFKDEMKRRKDFYQQRTSTDEELKKITGSPDEKCLYTSEFRAALEKNNVISLCLKRSDRLPSLIGNNGFARVVHPFKTDDQRYLLCPAGLTVGHLKRFIRFKLDLPPDFHIDIFHSDEALKEFYTLQEIASIYTWRQTSPLQLHYVLYSFPCLRESCEWNTFRVCSDKTLTTQSISRSRSVSHNKRDTSRSIDYVDVADDGESRTGNRSRLPSHSFEIEPSTELNTTIKEDSQDSCSTASDATIMEYEDSLMCHTESLSVKEMAKEDSLYTVERKCDAASKPNFQVNSSLYGGNFEHSSTTGAFVRREDDCVLTSVQNKESFSVLSDEINACCEHERSLDSTAVTQSQTDPIKNCVNCKVVRAEISGRTNVVVEDKIGFEAEALSATTGQWGKDCSAVERRCQLKVKRVHSEVRRLFIDENTPGAKRELRSFRHRFGTSGNDRFKNRHKLPLRSHAAGRVRVGSCRVSRLRVSCIKTSDLQKLN